MAVAVDSFGLLMDDILLPVLRRMEDVLAIIGLLYVGKVTLSTAVEIIVGVRAHFYSKLWKKKFVQRYGKWAVVTGCTDGIGKSYAEELAKEGMNIVLISRSMDKLKNVASDLGSKYNIETEIVQVNFQDGLPIYEKISKHLQNKEIGILVNNVGMMLPYPKYFLNVTEDEIWGHVNVNIASVPAMTKLVLPSMVARGKGAIVNISSISANGPIPLMQIYSASKAFVDNFSQGLTWEYQPKGIVVQTVIPSYLATNMTSYSSYIGTANIITPSAPVFAYHCVNTLGYTSRTTGYWLHGIQTWFLEKICSRWVYTNFMGYTQRFLANDYKKKSHKS